MNKKTITPNPQQPVDRVPTGQLPSALQELAEESLSRSGVLPANLDVQYLICSFDGDDE